MGEDANESNDFRIKLDGCDGVLKRNIQEQAFNLDVEVDGRKHDVKKTVVYGTTVEIVLDR